MTNKYQIILHTRNETIILNVKFSPNWAAKIIEGRISSKNFSLSQQIHGCLNQKLNPHRLNWQFFRHSINIFRTQLKIKFRKEQQINSAQRKHPFSIFLQVTQQKETVKGTKKIFLLFQTSEITFKNPPKEMKKKDIQEKAITVQLHEQVPFSFNEWKRNNKKLFKICTLYKNNRWNYNLSQTELPILWYNLKLQENTRRKNFIRKTAFSSNITFLINE